MPGFVDTHQHLFQYMLRGLGEGMELWPWLSDFMWPVSAAINLEEAAAGARLGALEAARSGVTSVVDNHYAPTDLDSTIAVADAIQSVGIRGAVARGMLGELTEMARKHGLAGSLFQYTNAEELEITSAAMDQREGQAVGVWPSPLNIIYNDQQLVHDAIVLAHERGSGWHTHCSEAETDPVFYLEEYNVRPADWLYDEGLLGNGATLAHGIFFDDREVERLGETSTGIAYCPVSHQYAALGVMRLRDLRASGAVIGLGLDGASGHRLDMFACMKQAILLQRAYHKDPVASNAEEALYMATRGGAEYMRIDAGYLAPGRLADVAVVDLTKPYHAPRHRALASLVYTANPGDVKYTVAGGKVIVDEHGSTEVDEGEVAAEATARAAELVDRAGLDFLLDPWRANSLDT